MGLQSIWEYQKEQGRFIKGYLFSENPQTATDFEAVCLKLDIEFGILPTDILGLNASLVEEILNIVKESGFVVLVLDIPSLQDKALRLRNYWRYNPTTEGIPFLYLVDELQLPREYDLEQGYDEIRWIAEGRFALEAGIKTVVAREDSFRRRNRKKG